jgi:hypothetical protein
MTTQFKRELKFKVLSSGAHQPDGKACLMEAVAYIAGERWSDKPECASPVLAAYGRQLNDSIRTDELRTEALMPLVPLLVGTRADAATELRRAEFLARYAVRVIVPIALRAAKLEGEAVKLESLPEDVGMDEASAAAWAARAAASAAAWVASEAASEAARAARASEAASAARAAASAAAWAAKAAARAAARAAKAAATAASEEVYKIAAEGLRHAIAITA